MPIYLYHLIEGDNQTPVRTCQQNFLNNIVAGLIQIKKCNFLRPINLRINRGHYRHESLWINKFRLYIGRRNRECRGSIILSEGFDLLQNNRPNSVRVI